MVCDDGEFLLRKTIDKFGEPEFSLEDEKANLSNAVNCVRANKIEDAEFLDLKDYINGRLICKVPGFRAFSCSSICRVNADYFFLETDNENNRIKCPAEKIVVFWKLGNCFKI